MKLFDSLSPVGAVHCGREVDVQTEHLSNKTFRIKRLLLNPFINIKPSELKRLYNEINPKDLCDVQQILLAKIRVRSKHKISETGI